MARVVHFEIHAEDPECAIAFYQKVFAWKFDRWNGPIDYWMIVTGPDSEPGINGGLIRRMGPGPLEGQAVNAYVCTVQVPQIDESVAAIKDAGGTVVVPKMAIPGVGWLVYFKDPEGNIVGVMQSDPTAK